MVSLTRSLITIMQDIVDQTSPINTRIKFTKDGVADGRQATMNPNIAKGSIQYPMMLIDWNTDLS